MQTSLCPYCFQAAESDTCPHCGNMVSYDQDPTHLPAGYSLAGSSDYLLGAAIGQGGFGITYAALDMKTNQRVAVKEYFPTYCSSRINGTNVDAYRGQEDTYIKGRERFLDEARMLKSLSDLNSVVNVLDFFEANNSAYLVMEFLDGASLKDHVEKNGKLPAQPFLNRLMPLMADMDKMHQRGVVHRDIAPDNIILLPDGRLKLIDFGAARSYVGDKSMTVVVKKGFAPVEQYMRKGSNASTDVYALAATIYYCITGIIPPDSAERQYGEAELLAPTALGVELSKAQELGLEKALAIQPKDRIQSVAELAKALAQIPKPVTPKPEKRKPEKAKAAPQKEKTPKPQPVPKQTADSPKRIKWWIPVAAVAIALCAGAAFLFAGQEDSSVPETPVQMEAGQTEAQPAVQLSAEAVKYNEAVDFFKNEEYGKAAIAFGKLGDYRDAREVSFKIWDAIADRNTFDTFGAIREDGTVVAPGYDVEGWTDIVAIDQDMGLIGLKADGTVLICDEEHGNWTVEKEGWSDIIAIDSGYHNGFYGVIGLKADGTAVALNSFDFYEAVPYNRDMNREKSYIEKLTALRDVVMIDGNIITTADGTLYKDFEITEQRYTDDEIHLREDGTVHYPDPESKSMEFWLFGDLQTRKKLHTKVSSWENIICLNSGHGSLIGLKSDGTLVAAGSFYGKENKCIDWKNIVAFCVHFCPEVRGYPGGYVFGLKSDGSVVACGSSKSACREAESWTNIKLPADRDALLAAIELDYITDSGDDLPPQPDAEEKPDVDISENILMGMGISEEESRRIGGGDNAVDPISKMTLFNTAAKRKDVRTITFLDTLKNAPSNASDASALGNGKVKAWAEQNGDFYDVYVAAEGGVLAPEDCDLLFSCMPNLTSIDFGNAFDTSKVTSMGDMFGYCKKLKALDLGSFDTSNVRDMGGIFYECFELESLDVTSFDTPNVTNMSCMFYMCKNLKTLDVTGFDTSNVTNMRCMFLQCHKLKELDLSSFDTSNVKDAFNMFLDCPVPRPDWYNYTMD